MKLIQNSTYLSTMSTADYYRDNDPAGDIRTAQGYATKVGPDAGEFLWHTGHSSDPCPCNKPNGRKFFTGYGKILTIFFFF